MAVALASVGTGASAAADRVLPAAALDAHTVGAGATIPSTPRRATMARHAARRITIEVTAHGADATSTRDSAAAVQAAFAAAKRVRGPVTIRFAPGTYQLWPEAAVQRELYVSNTTGADAGPRIKRIALPVEDMADVIVEGAGATLVFHGKQTVFAVIRSRDVTIRGFAVDWVAPSVVDLTVVGSGIADGHGWRDVIVPAGTRYRLDGTRVVLEGEPSPATGKPYWSYPPSLAGSGANQIRDLRTGTVRRAPTTLWRDAIAVRETAPGRLRITYAASVDPGGTGIVFEQRDDYRDTPGGLIWQSARTDLADLDIRYLHGFGIVAQFARDVSVDHVRLRTAPGTWRQTAGFADFLQFSGAAGHVQVLNSLFDNPHDDPINIHGTYVQVAAIDRTRRRVTLRYMHPQTAGFPQFAPGDAFRFVQRATMLPLPGRFTVRTVDGPSGSDTRHDLRTMTVAVDRPLPPALAVATFVAENMTWTPTVRIAGNTFRGIPTRGILVTTPRPVLIERNLFQSVAMASLFVSGDADAWYESGGVAKLTVRNNVFERPAVDAPVILFEPTNSRIVPGRTVHRDVAIVANRFAIVPGTQLLSARSVTGLTFARNLVTSEQSASALPSPSRPLFALQASAAVRITANSYAPGLNRRIDLTAMPATAVRGDGDIRIGRDWLVPQASAHAPRNLAALIPPIWSGVAFPPLDAGRHALAVVGADVPWVTTRFVAEHPTTRVTATFNDVTIAAPSRETSLPLRPGANVIEVRTYAGREARTYRWTIIADRPGAPFLAAEAR